jgi:hypothetical protein
MRAVRSFCCLTHLRVRGAACGIGRSTEISPKARKGAQSSQRGFKAALLDQPRRGGGAKSAAKSRASCCDQACYSRTTLAGSRRRKPPLMPAVGRGVPVVRICPPPEPDKDPLTRSLIDASAWSASPAATVRQRRNTSGSPRRPPAIRLRRGPSHHRRSYQPRSSSGTGRARNVAFVNPLG